MPNVPMLDVLIHTPLGHFARETPDHPALALAGRTMSYGELDAASDRLACALAEQGLERGDRVGLLLYKSFELAVGIYGALKAGGVFVPLDPMMPFPRLEFILRDCEVRHLVSSDTLAPTVSQVDRGLTLRTYGTTQTPFPGLAWSEVEAYPASPPSVQLLDQDLGYIMYTSGSTGRPKGMMHSHLGSVSYARWGAHFAELAPSDRVASHAPLHFDLSIFDFFSTLRAGATVVLVPEPVTKFPASWTRYIEEERISVVFTVPFTLMEMVRGGAMDERDLSSLRHVLFGGEPFPPKHLREVMERLPDVRFTNVYGPAEAPCCTTYDVPAPPTGDEPLPIGTVSENSRGLIVDERGEPCPSGELGELCIQSSTLTRGYWNRPDLNARAYLEHEGPGPFPNVWFRTGDMVVYGDDGLLRFLGRRDRMVKTRGHRVELAEVEAALVAHAAVLEAAAYTTPDGRGSSLVRAAVTLAPGASVDAGELVRHARALLPAYALPTDVEIVDGLPRTPTGKVDHRRLAEPGSEERNVS